MAGQGPQQMVQEDSGQTGGPSTQEQVPRDHGTQGVLLLIPKVPRSLLLVPSETGEPEMDLDFTSLDLFPGLESIDPTMEDPGESSNSMIIETQDMDITYIPSFSQVHEHPLPLLDPADCK